MWGVFMKKINEKMVELTDDELLDMVGGYASTVSSEISQNLPIRVFYGIRPPVDVKPLYGIEPPEIRPLYGIDPIISLD